MKSSKCTRMLLLLIFMCTIVSILAVTVQAQIVLRRPVLEYCTGTWCQYCPCGHSIIENSILPNVPDAIIVGYHGPANTASEPYSTFSGNEIISSLGFSNYPTGLVDRTSSLPVDRGEWYSRVNSRWNLWATVRIALSKTYDEVTRTMSGTVSVTPVNQLSGSYKLNLILLEDSLIYAQTGNSGCIGGSPYVHNHVVRAMINGYLGQDLNASSPWGVGQTVSKALTYTVPAEFVARRSKLVAFVYKVASPLSMGEIQQAEQWEVLGTVTSANETVKIPGSFALSQNYPNPFNPTTVFDYAVSKQSFVTIKVFSLLGQEVKTLVSDERSVGVYKAEWDGKNNFGKVVPTGMYVYRMTAGNFNETKKMILMK